MGGVRRIDAGGRRLTLTGAGGVAPALPAPPDASRAATPPRVLMLPRWPDNPYQERLVRQLEARGVAVRIGTRSDLWRPLRTAREGAQVVHLHGSGKFCRGRWLPVALLRGLASLLAVVALRLLGIPVVLTAHDLQDHDTRHPRLDRLFARALTRLTAQLIVHGERAEQQVRSAYRLGAAAPVAIVPHGPFAAPPRQISAGQRAALRRQRGCGSEQLVFLFLGAVRPYKGVLELCEAFASLPDPEARLWIRGRPRDPGYREAVARAAARAARVDFAAGFVSSEEVDALMAAADAVVTPYRSVLTSGSVILASCHGRACIAPRLGAIPDELPEDGALLYDPGAPGALRAALVEALARRDELPALGERARRRVEAHSWEAAAARTEELYRRARADA